MREALLDVVIVRPKDPEQTHPPFRIEVDDWRIYIGPAFAKAFAGAPDADALAAFASLERAGVARRNLRELAAAVAGEARNRLALAMFSRLLEGGTPDPVLLARTAAVIGGIDGGGAAAAWLRGHAVPEDLYSLARVLYEQREDALLWDGLPEPLPASIGDEVWLLRAAASTRTAGERTGRAEALQHYFMAASGTETYLLGRYLSRLSDEDSIRSSTRRTRTAWALGVRADAEGRRTDANDWYQVAVAGGKPTEPEYAFARAALRVWAKETVKVSDSAADPE